MKRKQLIQLAGCLVVLVGLAYCADVFERNPSNIRVPELDLPVNEVNALTLRTPDDTLELRLEGLQWIMHQPVSARADSATVSRFLQALGDMTLDKEATDEPDSYHTYGIVDSLATTVTLHWAGGSEDVTISPQGRDYMSIFVRVGDDPRIFSTKGRVTVTKDVSRWRDRLIARVNPAAVMSVQVTRPEESYQVTQSDGAWTIDGNPGDSLQVTNWLRRFNPINADGFFDDIPPQVLTDASYDLAFTLAAGTTTRFHALPHESAAALTRSGGQFTYRVYESRLDQLFPDSESLTRD